MHVSLQKKMGSTKTIVVARLILKAKFYYCVDRILYSNNLS